LRRGEEKRRGIKTVSWALGALMTVLTLLTVLRLLTVLTEKSRNTAPGALREKRSNAG